MDTIDIEFLLRWVHFLSGITWIGMLYYFNFVQTPFFKSCEGSTRSEMIRGLVPNALWWFRWGAMFTFLSGVSLVMVKAHGYEGAYPWDGVYMTIILTGGLMGTLMWFNVWFIIWPAQKVVIASAEQVAAGGEPIADAASRGGRAGMASRTNTLFSIPMLFCMGAAGHYQAIAGIAAEGAESSVMMYWIIAGVVIAVVEVTGAFCGAGKPFQKHLASVNGVITAGFVLTAVVAVLLKYVAVH
jgi:uncharacterized membrane protein